MMSTSALDAERREWPAARNKPSQACLLRFRPILMTPWALLGGLPLAWNRSWLGTASASGDHRGRRTLCSVRHDAFYTAPDLTLFTVWAKRFRLVRGATNDESLDGDLAMGD